jgi:hypothetical protein
MVGENPGLSWAFGQLIRISVDSEEWDEAERVLLENLALCRQGNVTHGTAYCLAGLALVAQGDGIAERAARLLGTAQAAREASQRPREEAQFTTEECDRLARDLRAELGEAAFTAAYEEGYTADFLATADELLAELQHGTTETQRARRQGNEESPALPS